jgi:ABC-2 type transport system ATP-binding protein
VITVEGLAKHYKVPSRQPGLRSALRSLLRRNYVDVRAVDGISFSIADGERVGFLGPNGAGKTTTLKVLAGLLHPSAGDVAVDGFTPKRRDEAFLRRIMLVMGQKQQLLWDLPPADTFELNRAIYDVPRADFAATVKELDELLELGPLVHKPTRQLSLGERMKCELAAALIHRPRVLFLDEPTIGLDVSMQARMRTFIKTYNERHGATLILTSHYMDDVLALCPRIVVIDKGKLSYDGSLTDLVHRMRPEKRVVFHLTAPVERDRLATFGKVVSHDAAQAVLHIEAASVNRVLSQALGALPIADMTVENAPLEEVMSELFARSRAS